MNAALELFTTCWTTGIAGFYFGRVASGDNLNPWRWSFKDVAALLLVPGGLTLAVFVIVWLTMV